MTPDLLATEQDEHILRIFRVGQDMPLLTQNAQADRRPYLHPLRAPDGAGILTEDAPPHHPWQHGLYVGLNDVNGVGFWKEGPEDGTFHPEPLVPPVVERNMARWSVVTAWHAPNGVPLLQEEQYWTFTDSGSTYTLDLYWRLTGETEITFGKSAYGGLFLRMPYRDTGGGMATNSEGQTNQEAEARRARWVAVEMPIEGRSDPAGLALMDHPENPEFPVPWRVDSQLGIAPSRSIAGAWHLAQGETTISRHRVLAFCGPTNHALIEENWQDFARRTF